MSSSSSLPRFARFNPSGHTLSWGHWLGVAAIACSLLALQIVWTVPASSVHAWQLIIGWLVVMGLLCLYRLGIDSELRDRRKNRPRSPVDIQHCYLIDNDEMSRISYRFSTQAVAPDGHIKIPWVSRRALLFLILPQIGVTVCAIALLVAGVMTHVRPQVLVLGLELWFLGSVIAWLWWNCYIFIVGRDWVRVVRDYPPWLWWVPDHPYGLQLVKCDTLHLQRSFGGRIFKYGSIESDSDAANDVVFNHVWGIPDANKALQVIADAITFAKQRVSVERSGEFSNRPPDNTLPLPQVQPLAGQPQQESGYSGYKPPPYRPY